MEVSKGLMQNPNPSTILPYAVTNLNHYPRSSAVDPFTWLPDEVIIKILSNLNIEELLTTASAINRKFREICLDTSLFKRLKLSGTEPDCHSAIKLLGKCSLLNSLQIIHRKDCLALATFALQHCPSLQDLQIEVDHCLDLVLQVITEHGGTLRRLTLTGRWNSQELVLNPGSLKNLTHLDLNLTQNKNNIVDIMGDNRVMRVITDNCTHIKKFSITNAKHLSDEEMGHFLESAKNTIESLCICGCSWLTNVTYENLIKCKKLVLLNIDNFASTSGMEAIAELSQLRELRGVRFSGLVTNEDYIRVFSSCKLNQLISLAIKHWEELTDEGLTAIVDNCPELVHLNLSVYWNDGVTRLGLMCVLHKCSKLLFLELDGMKRLTQDMFLDIRAPLCELIIWHIGTFESEETLELLKEVRVRYPKMKVRTS